MMENIGYIIRKGIHENECFLLFLEIMTVLKGKIPKIYGM